LTHKIMLQVTHARGSEVVQVVYSLAARLNSEHECRHRTEKPAHDRVEKVTKNILAFSTDMCEPKLQRPRPSVQRDMSMKRKALPYSRINNTNAQRYMDVRVTGARNGAEEV